jgi:hypothetical protein
MMDEIPLEAANKNTNATSDASLSTDGTMAVSRQWMLHHSTARTSQSFLNAYQRTSIAAMIAYISSRSGQSEFRVERSLSDRFNVPNSKYLPANNYDEAIRYLADILSA